MKLPEDSIITLAQEGRMTLQVPTCWYGEPAPKLVDYPDDWFIHITGGRPALGREKGFLHLTRAGWEANKEDIRKAYEGSGDPEGSWQEFEKFVEVEFVERKKALQKHRDNLRKKMKDAEALLDSI